MLQQFFITSLSTSHRLNRSFWRFFHLFPTSQVPHGLVRPCAIGQSPAAPGEALANRTATALRPAHSGPLGTGRHVAGIGAHKGLITIAVGHVNWHLFEQDLKAPPELKKIRRVRKCQKPKQLAGKSIARAESLE